MLESPSRRGIAGVVAVALAGGIIWLKMTQPVMVADSVAKATTILRLARAIAGRCTMPLPAC